MITEKPRSAGQVLLISSDKIKASPNQPRKIFNQEELVNLAISIRMNGLLQPITVREVDKGYELVSGERRLRAAKLAGMALVPSIVIDVGDMKSAIFSLIENLQRQDLNYFEEAVAIQKLMTEFGISQEEAAKKLGKAPSTVSNKLRLLGLPKKAQKMLLESGLSERHARALLKLTEEDVVSALENIIAKKLNVAQTERLVETLLAKNDKPKRITKRMFSDVRIFLNTVNKAVETMQGAGINAGMKKEETEEAFIYEITIPKSSAYKNNV